MDPLILSSLITTGGSLLGGFMSDNAAEGMTAEDRAFTEHMFGKQARFIRGQESRARRDSRYAMSNALRLRVQDAKAAGIHPLAALGAQMNLMAPAGGGAPSVSGGSGIPRDAKGHAVQMAALEIGRMVADREESESRTELNKAQAAALKAELVLKNPGRGPNNPVPEGHDVKNPQFTSHTKVLGKKIRSSPFGSDAETYETRYGELGGSLMGLTNIPLDLIYTVVKDISEALEHLDPVYSTFD